MKVEKAPPPDVFPDAKGKKFAIIVATFYADLAAWLEDGAKRGLRDCDVADDAVEVFRVPGCFELPVTARRLIRAGDYDGMIALGVVVRGGLANQIYAVAASWTSRSQPACRSASVS